MTRVEISWFKTLIAARTDPLTGKPLPGWGANVLMLRNEVAKLEKMKVDNAAQAAT